MDKTEPVKPVRALGRGLAGLLKSTQDLNRDLSRAAPRSADSPDINRAAPPSAEPPAGDLHRDAPTASDPALNIRQIPLDQIIPGTLQTRKIFDPAALNELAASIKEVGVIQPVVVRVGRAGGAFAACPTHPNAAPTVGPGPTYELISGERRWRAAKLAGLSAIPALIREEDDLATLQVSLIENVQRAELNPVERARAYALFCDSFQLTAETLAQRTGEDRTTVTNYLRLLELPLAVLDWVVQGLLSMSHARTLLSFPDESTRLLYAQTAIDKELTVRDLELLAARVKVGKPAPRFGPQPQTAAVQHLEEQISAQLGIKTKVRLGTRKGTGRILFKFSTLDEFDRLMAALNVKLES